MILECKLICKVSIQIFDSNTLLLHGITEAYGNAAICLGIKIVSYAERSTDLILTTISLTNVSSVIKFTVVFLGKLCVDLLRTLVQFLGQRQHTDLYRCQCGMEMKHSTNIAAL